MEDLRLLALAYPHSENITKDKIIKTIYLILIFLFYTDNANASNYKVYLNFVESNSRHICDVLIGKTKLSDD